MPRASIELTEAQKAEVETLAALLNQEQIADYFGIARNTFRAICDRDPEVAARYKRGKAKAIAHVANGLLQKARSGDTTSSIFFLKTQAGRRETERIEHSGPYGAPLHTWSDEDLHAEFARVTASLARSGTPLLIPREDEAREGECVEGDAPEQEE